MSHLHFTQEISEERFVIRKGLNDILISFGILLFSLAGLIQIIATSNLESSSHVLSNTLPILWYELIKSGVALLVLWLLAEYLTRHCKLVLPSIVLVISFSIFAYIFFGLMVFTDGMSALSQWLDPHDEWKVTPGTTVAIIGSMFAPVSLLMVYYKRFQFPFTLLLISFMFALALSVSASLVFVGLDSAPIFLAWGVLTFSLAMYYDVKDPKRKTRISDCAFWLHMSAAPLIFGGVRNIFIPDLSVLSSSQAWFLFLITCILSLLSLIIDRRSLLISGLFYLGLSVAYAADVLIGIPDDNLSVISITLGIIGAVTLALGIGWAPIRRFVLRVCIPERVLRYLHPVED
jgi:hypothetical protein